jgi:hypothetical protein
MSKIIRLKERSKLQWLQDPSKINGDNQNNYVKKPIGISRIKSGNI